MSESLNDAIMNLQAAKAYLEMRSNEAEEYIRSVPARIQAARDEALAQGATLEQLAALDQVVSDLIREGDELEAARQAVDPHDHDETPEA